jgi:hypothetical protein
MFSGCGHCDRWPGRDNLTFLGLAVLWWDQIIWMTFNSNLWFKIRTWCMSLDSASDHRRPNLQSITLFKDELIQKERHLRFHCIEHQYVQVGMYALSGHFGDTLDTSQFLEWVIWIRMVNKVSRFFVLGFFNFWFNLNEEGSVSSHSKFV